MPLAVTHFVITVIIFTLIRDFFIKNKKKFPVYYVFLGGLAGLLPDFDFAISILLFIFSINYNAHRTFTHTLFMPLIFFIASVVTIKLKPFKIKTKIFHYTTLLWVIGLGILIHLILDSTIGGYIYPLYPISNISLGLNFPDYLPDKLIEVFFPILDAALLIIWISYLEFKHKISSFF